MDGLPAVVSQQVLGPEALAAAILNANFQPCQLSMGPSPSMIARVMCPRVCLDIARIGPAMLFSGSMAGDCYTLVFVTECKQKGRSFNFAVEHNDGYLGLFPPGGMLDAFTPEGYENVTLTVPTSILETAVDRMYPEIPPGILKLGAGMLIGAREQARLRWLLLAVMEGIQDPSAPLTSDAVRHQLEMDLLDGFLAALRNGCGALIPTPGFRVSKRLRQLKRARGFLADHLHESVSIAALCGELGMSRRGIEGMFQDLLGISPNTFHRHQRLHGARRAIKQAPPKPGIVKQIALACGFWHMGHFAADYRELFGESPSKTLAGRG